MQAFQLGTSWNGPAPAAAIRRVIVVGMGGSAIGARLAQQVIEQRAPLAVELVQDLAIPMTDEHTLIIAASFSGETDEVLTAFRAARHRPGSKLVITRGGALAREAEEAGVPVIRYEYTGEPRSAIGFGVMVLLGLLHRLGLFPVTDAEVRRAIMEIAACGAACQPDVPFERNTARLLASQLRDRIPVVLADASLAAAALRWQNQCHENSKRWAFAGVVPEVLHNLVEGIQTGAASGLASVPFHVVLLEDETRPQAARARIAALEDHLGRTGVGWSRLSFNGTSDLSILFQASLVGDWVSYYLALEAGSDPSPVPVIASLKERLALVSQGAR